MVVVVEPASPTLRDADTESQCSTISGLSQEEVDEMDEQDCSSGIAGCSRSSMKPRSIFGSYWKTTSSPGDDSPLSSSRRRAKIVIPPSRALSPTSVLPTTPRNWQDHPFMPAYMHEGYGDDEDEDEFSANTYEKTLKDCEQLPTPPRLQSRSPYENPPLSSWTSWFSGYQSDSCLLRAVAATSSSWGRGDLGRQVQSDSALLARPKASLLRQGRFSSMSPNSLPSPPRTKRSDVHPDHHVRFQAKIEVCEYHPPTESWAAEGWSLWFGI